jgi:hypothetical protein
MLHAQNTKCVCDLGVVSFTSRQVYPPGNQYGTLWVGVELAPGPVPKLWSSGLEPGLFIPPGVRENLLRGI